MSARNPIPACPPWWTARKIGDVLAVLPNGKDLHQGWSPQCLSEPAAVGEWGVLKTTAIQPGAFLPEHNKALPPHLEPRPDIVVEQGDLLLTCAGPRSRCGIPCLVRRTPSKLMMSGKMYRFRPRDDLATAAFIEAQLLAQPWQDAIDDMKTGISDSGLNLTHGRFRDLPVHLPPVEEQHRIVVAIETHFSRLDAAVASLTRAKANVKRARASVLKAAVEGRLVPTEAALARAEGRDYEPASVLLDRILAERKAAWAASGARGKYKQPVKPETEGLPGLPEGWCWTSMDAVLREPLRNGKSAKASQDDSGIRTLTLTAVTTGQFVDENTKLTVATSDQADGLWLEPGDLLIQRSNTPELVGTPALYRGARDWAVFPDLLIRVRPTHRVSVEFVTTALTAPALRRFFRENAKGIAGSMPKIGQDTIQAAPLPVPPLAEQHRIVAEVDRRLSVLDALAATLDANLARCARLRQAVLKRAFEGRLVPAEAAAARPASLASAATSEATP